MAIVVLIKVLLYNHIVYDHKPVVILSFIYSLSCFTEVEKDRTLQSIYYTVSSISHSTVII